MNKSRFLTLTFALALLGYGSAYAQAPALAAGTYKLEIGSKAPCDLTVTADGGVTQGADCATGTNLTKLSTFGSSYQLMSASGELYGVLKAKGDTLVGTTAADQRKLVISH
ncbi:MAG: hypothetical protein JSR60_18215 [Proteobacteria bacterium]|nr:hypothetical protein [Pseudomonadota bacterium]